MKKLVVWTLVGTALCFVGLVWLNRARSKDPGYLIGFALGNPSGDSVELHVVVSAGMTGGDNSGAGGAGDTAAVEQWINHHFVLRDSSGQAMPLRQIAASSLISERQAHDPAFYLVAKLRPGTTGTLDYIPSVTASKRYRHTFPVPPDSTPFQRVYFKPVVGS
jgi:hypothetical protein